MLKNLFPPKTEDHTKEWLEENYDITTENWENYSTVATATIKRLKTKQQEDRYIRLAGYNVADDPNGESGTDDSGIQWSPSSANAYYIAPPTNSYTNIRIYSEQPNPTDKTYRGALETEFVGAIEVRVPSSGGTSDGPFINASGNVVDGWCGTRTQRAGARMNVNIHMDPDYNSFFQYKFDAWLPNFGRFSEAPPSAAPTSVYNPPIDNPSGYLANTSGNAQSIETQPPSRQSQVQATYELEFADLGVGTTTEYWGGEGAWIITDSTGGNDSIFTWSPNLNAFSQYTRNGAVSDDGLWQWVYTENSGEWTWTPNPNPFLSDDQQWIYDGTEWVANLDFVPEIARDPVNNPTRYRIKLRAIEPNYDDDGNEVFNSPNYSSGQDDYQYIAGTNSWQTFQGNFFATTKYVRLYVEITQRDIDKDFDPRTSTTSQLDVNGNAVNLTEQFGNRWWRFFLKNIEMRFQNNNDLKFPLEWERFQSNMIINPSSDYLSPFFEKNNFLMVGGLSKDSYHFKTLASIAGYDFQSLSKKENFNYDKYNPYDVISILDTLAKYDETLYDEYLDPYTEEIYDVEGELINNGSIDKNWHGTFKNTFLTETDVATTRVYNKVKPMWEQLGFDNDEFDKPDRNIYWKNILPKDLDLSNRVGVTQRDLPDPKKGSLTPRIPRKEFIVDEEATQYWNGGYYWPTLPKFTKEGAFSDQYPQGTENQTYGKEDARITSKVDSDTNIIFDLFFDGDEIVDQTDSSLDTTLNTDFSLKINDDDRAVKNVIDFVDTIEKTNKEQAF